MVKYLVLLFLFGCASSGFKRQESLRNFVSVGDYQSAGKVIDSELSKKNKKTEILNLMERGVVYFYEQNYTDAITLLTTAKEKMNELVAIRVGEVVKTQLTNELSRVYEGEVYERCMVHFYLSLSRVLLWSRGHTLEKLEDGLLHRREKRKFSLQQKNKAYSIQLARRLLAGIIS